MVLHSARTLGAQRKGRSRSRRTARHLGNSALRSANLLTGRRQLKVLEAHRVRLELERGSLEAQVHFHDSLEWFRLPTISGRIQFETTLGTWGEPSTAPVVTYISEYRPLEPAPDSEITYQSYFFGASDLGYLRLANTPKAWPSGELAYAYPWAEFVPRSGGVPSLGSTPSVMEARLREVYAELRFIQRQLELLEIILSLERGESLELPGPDVRSEICARLGYACGPPPPAASNRWPTLSNEFLSGLLDQGPHISQRELAAETAEDDGGC